MKIGIICNYQFQKPQLPSAQRSWVPFEKAAGVHAQSGLQIQPWHDGCYLFAWHQSSGCHGRRATRNKRGYKGHEKRFNQITLHCRPQHAAVDIMHHTIEDPLTAGHLCLHVVILRDGANKKKRRTMNSVKFTTRPLLCASPLNGRWHYGIAGQLRWDVRHEVRVNCRQLY